MHKDSDGKDKQLDNVLNNKKIDILWDGYVGINVNISIPNYKDYEMLFILIQTAYNYNGFIIVPKTRYNGQYNYGVYLSGNEGFSNYYINPANFPNFSLGGASDGKVIEVLGLKLK
ncbi:MAG: hypothetical protein RR904_05495 [Bacilli bacterium]